ncbi:hypothetical protein WA588_006357 [Blastocystis sp. NMH]
MEFEEIVTVRQIKSILHNPSAHVEQRYGTAKETIEYCKKDNNFMEFGKPKAQGERNDLNDVGIERVQDLFRRKQQKLEERVQPTVLVYIGKSGTGKTHHCYHDPDYQASGYKFPVQQAGKVYFDGYDGESTIWFDEFGGSVLPFGIFLRLCDKLETLVETKGSSVCITNLRKILISTTTYPKNWWRDSRKYQEDPRQLWRRLTHVFYIPYIMLDQNTSEMKWPKNWIDVLKSGEDGDQEMQSWKESEATNPATQLLSTIVAMMGLSGSGSSDVDNDSRLDPLFQLLLLPSEDILNTFDSP